MHQSPRLRWFSLHCLFMAVLLTAGMPLGHAWHSQGAHAPGQAHAHHGHDAPSGQYEHGGDHKAHTACEDDSAAVHESHQRMQCDCLLCQLAKLPVLMPDLPTAHALARQLQTDHCPTLASATLAGHALTPPSRGPPPLQS
ncbi:MAG: DUF2946 family protein [Ectothiorhodospiraceae bacterium]|nr:DUF2946 family protein [Ectothiorhodospiraceae bacterium]